MMLIRRADPNDLDAVTALEAACFPPAEAAGRESFRARLAAFADRFFLLEQNGRVVSMVNGCVSDDRDLVDAMFADASLHKPDGRWQMLFGVATLPEKQRHGYAGTLLRLVIEDCRARGLDGVVLTCKERLLPYYARFGFVNEGLSVSEHGGAAWYQMRITFREERP